MPKITIDGKSYEVPAGKNLLETCLNLGLDLPYFCWHPAMGSVGSCRQCALVQYQNEEDTRGRIVMGCMTSVTEGARLSLHGENARQFRESVIESLMTNHPHDCPVCAEGGECHLQDMTVMVGHRDRKFRGEKRTFRNQYLGPLVHHEMNRCITCYRCVRFYQDYAGGTDLAAMAIHNNVYFGRHEEGILQSEFAGNLVEVCPTGVFTDKHLVNDYTRKWDLQVAPSICGGCALGCNTSPGERYGKLKRTHNRYNHQVNGYFLCDRGRYGGGHVNSAQRLDYSGLQNSDGTYTAVHGDHALEQAVAWCKSGNLFGIGSPRASVEANYLLRHLVGAENFSAGFSDQQNSLVSLVAKMLRNTRALNPSLKHVESADAVVILGEDVTNTAPRLALALRQSVRNKAYAMADNLKLEHWQDAAIRNLAQDEKSPLFIAAVAATRLDDVATETFRLAPPDIARLGFEITAAIRGESSGNEQVAHIAEVLKSAKKPLVVSGTGLLAHSVIQAAAQIAEALASTNDKVMLSLCLPESNSMGVELLTQGQGKTLGQLADENIDTLIVLENDLYRRGVPEQINTLLAKVKQLIVLDTLDTPTTSRSQLALPAAALVESEGTLISSEGRAQRYYPVFLPAKDRQPSWQWLCTLGQRLNKPGFAAWAHFDAIEAACAASNPLLQKITEVAPDHSFRHRGLKIPRQPHRYSGRTAMRANISVHEPKQPVDEETPLAFSMEGKLPANELGSLLPFVWSPGWNSNQSVSKFQVACNAELRGQSAGVRLIDPGAGWPDTGEIPTAFQAKTGQWLLVPLPRIFGSDELSSRAPEIAELAGEAFVALHPADAETLGVTDGDGVDVGDISLEVRIEPTLVEGCVGFLLGFPGTESLIAGITTRLQKAESWQRSRPEIIARDREAVDV